LSVAGNSAITGNETVGGTLDVTGNTTLGNTLDVTGNTTLGADLSVAGNSAITGNETIGGTLGVTGATTLGSTLEVTDATTLNGATAINNTLDVTGNTTLGADLTVTGITNLNGSSNIGDAAADVVTVNGTTTFNAPVTVADGQATTLNGNVTLGNTSADVIEVNGTTNFDAAITVNSTATFAGVSTFAHPINLQNGGDVSGGILKPTTGSIAANNVTIDPALVQAADPVYALNATLQNSTHVDLYEIAKPFGNTFTNTLPAATTDGVVMVWDEVGSKWVYDEASALIGGGINMTNTNAVPRWDGADLVDGQMSDDGANIVTIGVDATGVAKTANLVVDNTTGAEVITATGNLDVTGDETIGGTLDVTGITTLAGDLTANGNTTLGDAASDLIQVSGTATFAEPISGNIAGGTANQVYVTDGTNGNWVDAAPLATNLAGATVHGIAYQSAADVTAFTAAGTTGQILSVNGSGVPTWLAAPISANQVLIAGAAGNPPHWVNAAPLATNVAAGAALQIPYQTAANTTGFVTAPTTANQVLSYDGTNLVWANPVTTLAASYSATPADNTITTDATGGNVVIAGTEALEVTATGGIVGNLTGNVTGDLTGNVTGNVTGDLTGNVTGNVTGDVTGDLTGNVTGDLTGNVTGNVTGDLTGNVTGDVTGDLTGDVTGNILGGTANQVYVSDGTNGTWANAAPLATYLAGGTANGIAYQSATDVTAFTAAGTAGQVLTAGTGGVPAWSNLPVATGGTGATGAEAYPANPVIGQLFFYTDTGTTTVKIYVYSAASTWTMVAEI